MDTFHWTPQQIGKLTWFQIVELCFHERDEYGGMVPPTSCDVTTPEDQFRRRWREFGVSEETIDRKWEEFVELAGFEDSLEKKGTPRPDIDRMKRDYERRMMAKRTWGR